jgi:hypothetical protein
MAIGIRKPAEQPGVYIDPGAIVEAISTYYKGPHTIGGGSKWRFDHEFVQSSPGNFRPISIDDQTWSAFLREYHERGSRA